MSSGRPSILSKSSTQTTELPTQEDQIRGYRAMTRGRYQAARATRRVFRRNNYNITLESDVDLERQLELSRERRANLVPAEVLYSNNRSTARHKVYQHYSEQRILSAGTNALVVLRDTRWEHSRQIIGTMEVDLFAGTQLVYMFSDMVQSIDDFHNHVEVAVQTYGYDTWQGAIPGERRCVKELEGMSWNLKPSEQTMDCLNEARTLEEEPLNKVKRSSKPKRSKQRSWEKLSTVGEPSGKWDYYVRYDTLKNTVPIEEITATDWGDEFSDSEATPGKVTILDQKDDWDDDERGGGKILHKSEMECENPFAAKRENLNNWQQQNHQIINKHEEHAFPIAADDTESSTSYQPPPDAIIGPAVYPSARQIPQPTYKPDYQFGYRQGKGNTFYEGYGEYHNSQWTLPPAWTESRVMLVLPTDPGLWSDVISRWESITINRLNSKTWFDNKVKLAFVEKLLGEREKLMWQQWRTAYPEVYSALETIADEPQILGFLTGIFRKNSKGIILSIIRISTILNISSLTIPDQKDDWDDDERGGGKILVLQEQFSQNQQDFLDEYLLQWDDQFAIQQHKSEMEWENPFAAKRSEDHTVLHLSKNEEKDDDLPYPKFRKFKQLATQIINKHEEHAFPTAADDAESSTSYQPLPDAIMGPAWTLPPTWMESGVMLVLPADPGLWSDVISRWKSITINRLNSQTWSDNKAKLAFVQNLLRESEKLMRQQWRTAYPGEYSAHETIADDPKNITSQVRQLIIMEDPYRGSTDEQDRAYRDLD
ncbi:hypothetical protein Tco_1310915 [Tanacetum coccineum]